MILYISLCSSHEWSILHHYTKRVPCFLWDVFLQHAVPKSIGTHHLKVFSAMLVFFFGTCCISTPTGSRPASKDAKRESIIVASDNSGHLHLTTVDERVTHGFCVFLNRDTTSGASALRKLGFSWDFALDL